jgi:hypothetical protein
MPSVGSLARISTIQSRGQEFISRLREAEKIVNQVLNNKNNKY